jgi:hypothetical protein
VSQTTERNWLNDFSRDRLISAERDGYFRAASPPITAVRETYQRQEIMAGTTSSFLILVTVSALSAGYRSAACLPSSRKGSVLRLVDFIS